MIRRGRREIGGRGEGRVRKRERGKANERERKRRGRKDGQLRLSNLHRSFC